MNVPREQWNHWATIDENHATNNICEGENNWQSNRLQNKITLNTVLPFFPRIKISNPDAFFYIESFSGRELKRLKKLKLVTCPLLEVTTMLHLYS